VDPGLVSLPGEVRVTEPSATDALAMMVASSISEGDGLAAGVGCVVASSLGEEHAVSAVAASTAAAKRARGCALMSFNFRC
jgi:hypothetical protein